MLERRQFGRPLAANQLVQKKLADMQTEIAVALGALKPLHAVGLRPHPHRIGPDVQANSAPTRAVEHCAFHPERTRAHSEVGIDGGLSLLAQRQLAEWTGRGARRKLNLERPEGAPGLACPTIAGANSDMRRRDP